MHPGVLTHVQVVAIASVVATQPINESTLVVRTIAKVRYNEVCRHEIVESMLTKCEGMQVWCPNAGYRAELEPLYRVAPGRVAYRIYDPFAEAVGTPMEGWVVHGFTSFYRFVAG
jgi:hypothetical protein